MTAINVRPVTTHIDAALEVIGRDREYVMAERPSALRSTKLAMLYEREARWWSVLFEQSRTRVHWRAALCAHEHARQVALSWRRRAAMQRAQEAGGAT